MNEIGIERSLAQVTRIDPSTTTVYDTGKSYDPDISLGNNLSNQPTNSIIAENREVGTSDHPEISLGNIEANDPTPSQVSKASSSPITPITDTSNSFKELDITVELLPYLEDGVKQHPQILNWLNTRPRRRVFASSSLSLFAEVTRILMTTNQRGDFSEDDRNYIRDCCTMLQGVGFDESWISYVHGCIIEEAEEDQASNLAT